MSEEQARGIRERRLGYNDGLKAGDKWTDGDAEPQPDLAKSDDYRSGFKLGFDEKAEYKRPLRDLLVGTIPSDVDFAAMKGNFDKYNEFGEKQPLDETPLDLSLYDEEGEGGDAEDEGEGAEGEGEGAGGAMGMIAQMLQGTVNFLKTDPIKETYDGAREEPPYPALQDLYDRVKENPDDQDVIEEASTSFTELKNGFQPEGCDTDINIAMKQRCAGVKAGLYLGLYDIRKSVDESLKQMRPIQQPGVLGRIDRAARPEYEVANNGANVFVPADL